MTQDNSLYDILKVPRDAKPNAIKASYRAEAMRHHPDRLPPTASPEEKAAAMEAFQKLKDAYDVLMDRERREQYDLSGQVPKSKHQLATEAAALLLQAFTSVVDQMATLVVENPIAAEHMRSPVAVIQDTLNERLVDVQQRVRAARDKRKALKRVIKGLRRKDGTDVSATPVMLSLNELIVAQVRNIVLGETEMEVLRVALKLNGEWDYTKPPKSEDDYDSMLQLMRLAYGDSAVTEPTTDGVDGEDEPGENTDAEDWPEWGEEDGAEPESEERAA